MAFAIDLLIILMPLASEDDDIVGGSGGDQMGDGIASAGDEFDVGRLGEPRANIIEDPLRVFGTRIVVGDQHAVSQALGHFSHQRTLAAITIATAAKQAQQATMGVRTQGFEDLFQRIGRMGVIDHHQRLLATPPGAACAR